MAASERVAALDVLRGAALFGILIMNMPGFSHSLFAPPPLDASVLDRVVVGLREALFAGKFNLLFGLAFGIGFALQLRRLDRAEPARAARIYSRRLAVLLAIGGIHAALLWPGDVLLVYALLGFALLAVRHASDRALLALLGACLLYPATIELVRPALLSAQTETLAAFAYESFHIADDLAFGTGSFADAVAETARIFAWAVGSPLGLYSYAAFFVQMATGILAGYLIGRHGWAERLPELGPAIVRWQRRALTVVILAAAAGLAVGVVQSRVGTDATSAVDADTLFGTRLARTIGRAALAAFYALSLARLLAVPRCRRWLMLLAPAGRMPLSNYLLQTAMASFIFYGWGLGLWGRVSPLTEALLACALFALVQLPLSAWWLGRFGQGPVEALWRRLTYRGAPS